MWLVDSLVVLFVDWLLHWLNGWNAGWPAGLWVGLVGLGSLAGWLSLPFNWVGFSIGWFPDSFSSWSGCWLVSNTEIHAVYAFISNRVSYSQPSKFVSLKLTACILHWY
jgi:hypothetical protein